MQRLKLAASLRRGRQRTLFLMDEPSTGLHPRDVSRLLKVFASCADGRGIRWW
jgi:excinuclease ABC subunit A